MQHTESKLDRATVVAGFDTQWDADEALLGLRLSGIPDSRIGYYHAAGSGKLTDELAGRHRLAASVIGGAIGAAAGALAAYPIARLWTSGFGPDLLGLMVTCAICGALFLGTAGGMAGLWTERPGATAASHGESDPFVLAVDAGDKRDEVRAVLRQHGGHDLPAHPA